MLMPRPPYTTTTTSNHNNNNIINLNSSLDINITAREMEQISQQQREQQQQQHISQLLTTAAAGTGVVGDVDALLTPNQLLAAAQLMEQRPERNLWRTDEIMQMLKLMQKTNAIEQLNDKTIKSENVFRTIEDMMHVIGYRKKSHVQIWTKWKFLKSTYTTSKRNGVVPKVIPYEIYEVLHKMLSGSSSDCNSTNASMDGDNSNGGRMVISGVEGSYSNGNNKNGAGGVDSEDESGFGMAHPIFGFRLGMVKAEPVDTGYENNTNNGNDASDKDQLDEINPNSPGSTTASIRFETEIKQEIDEEPFPTALEQQHHQSSEILLKKRPVRITAIPAVTSTPHAKAAGAASSSSSPNTASWSAAVPNPQLPPLRIAPFAKAPSSDNAIVQQQATLNRPPPPLSMHPGTPRPVRMTSNMQGSGNGKFILPKIMPKPGQVGQVLVNMPVRLPKDITIQTRSAANANMPRLKQVPMRKTPYSLRPDRMIPDLSASISPPPVMQKQYAAAPMYHHQDGPTTSQRVFNSQPIPSRLQTMMMDGNRKRRLEIPPMPARSKIPCTMNSRQIPPQNYYNGGGDDTGGDNNDDDPDDESAMFDCASMQRASFNASTQQQFPTAKAPIKPAAGTASRKDQVFFESALKDLGTSLRQMQREMISDFFEKQMELARREHEFQMKQDLMIMQAFEEQTQQIMRSAKQLLGVDLKKSMTPTTTKATTTTTVTAKCGKSAATQKIKPAAQRKKTKAAMESTDPTEAMIVHGQSEDAQQTVETEAATGTLDDAGHHDAAEEDEDDSEEAEEDEDDVEDVDGEDNGENDQLEYEDDEYLHDNNIKAVQQIENEEDSDEDEEEEDNEENELVNGQVVHRTNGESAEDNTDEDENENAERDDQGDEEDDDEDDDDDDDDDVNAADPIQLVSSELVEGN